MRIAVACTLLLLAASPSTSAQDYQPAINDVISALDRSMTRGGLKSIAILGVTDLAGHPTCLGDLLAEELAVGLASGDRSYHIVSRNDSKLKAALSEQKLGRSGLIDPQSAAQVGQLIGVQTLAMGTVTAVGDNMRLTLSLIDTATARIVGGAAATFPRTKSIEDYVANCATANAPTPDADPARPKSKMTSVQGFDFELDGCVRSGGAVTCALWVTNRRDDRSFFIGNGVGLVVFSAYDDQGNAYTGRNVQVANKPLDPLGAKLISGVRTRVILYLDGTVTGVALTRLEFSASSGDVGFFKVTLSDVPITNKR